MNFASYLILTAILLLFGWALYKLIKKKGVCPCGTIGSKSSDCNTEGCSGHCTGCSCGCGERKDVK